jgi:uncharacterized OsmC-like protein
MSDEVTIHITRQEGYRYLVEFGPQYATLIADEPEPLGQDSGPSPQHLLAAAIANCLCASLTFACAKYHGDPGEVSATVACRTGRNERNRVRVRQVDVTITLGAAAAQLPHLDRALASFEDFCTVTASVREGIAVAVTVRGPDGAALTA